LDAIYEFESLRRGDLALYGAAGFQSSGPNTSPPTTRNPITGLQRDKSLCPPEAYLPPTEKGPEKSIKPLSDPKFI